MRRLPAETPSSCVLSALPVLQKSMRSTRANQQVRKARRALKVFSRRHCCLKPLLLCDSVLPFVEAPVFRFEVG